MKAHGGVDSASKIVRTLVTTAANVHDSNVFRDLLHGDETRVWGDSAYTGKSSVMREKVATRSRLHE
jgi:IS5 family transposase